jgi:hypothetical protein
MLAGALVLLALLLLVGGGAVWRASRVHPSAQGAEAPNGVSFARSGPVRPATAAPGNDRAAGDGDDPASRKPDPRAKAGLAGRVLDAGGGPIARARITAASVPIAAQTSDSLRTTTISDSEGRYQLPLAPGDYQLQAEAEGYAPARFAAYLHLPLVRDFRLNPASRITGRVVSRPGGAPLPHAEISVVDTQSLELAMVTRTVQADDDGAFVIAGLDPSSYRLIAHAGPFVGQHPRPLILGLAQSLAVEVVLDRGRTVAGTVHAADGSAAPDVDVFVPFGPREYMSTSQPGVRARTDQHGRFRLEGLPPLGLDITAVGPAGEAREALDLASGDRTDVVLQLTPTATVAGVVLDRQRRPVAEARVSAITSEPARRAYRDLSAVTDATGQFRITGGRPGALTVTARHDIGTAQLAAGTLAPGATMHVELVLGDGASVAGTVRRHDGTPARGAQVFAFAGGWSPQAGPQPSAATRAADDGSFRLPRLPPGEVIVRAGNPGDDPFAGVGSQTTRPDRVSLVLGADEQRTGVDLVVMRNDLALRGRIVDEQRRPVAGATVNAIPGGSGAAAQVRTLSQEDGRFALEGLGTGPHTLVVAHPDFPELARVGLSAGGDPIDIVLPSGASLAGVVLDRSGRPAPDFEVVARPLPGPQPTEGELRASWMGPRARAAVLAQADGTFALTVPEVPGVRYQLVAYLPDRSAASVPPVTLASGQPITGLRLQARPAATIRGRAVDHRTGAPIAGARVAGRGMAAGVLAGSGDADDAGRFALPGLPANQPVEFAVIGPGGAYLTDCQHRTAPDAGGTLDIGDVPLFAGPAEQLTLNGQFATGLWFHSQDGRPTVHAVRAGSPAAAAGVRPGELVLKVGDTDVRALSSSVVEGLVATAHGSVRLTVQSMTAGAPRTLEVPRPAN